MIQLESARGRGIGRERAHLAVASLFTVLLGLAGCHYRNDPNDPNINPKAYHALRSQAESNAAAINVLENYDVTYEAQHDPRTGARLRVYTYTLRPRPILTHAFRLYYNENTREFRSETIEQPVPPTAVSGQ